MKTDELERFILQNRDEFDSEEPDPSVWMRIEQKTRPAVRIRWGSILWKAAAVIVIFAGSYLFFDLTHRSDVTEGPAQEIPVPEEFRELMEADGYYSARIAGMKEEIIRVSGNDEQILSEINIDLGELDTVFEELKRDLRENGDNKEVIRAMIQNYRIKLQILEEILLQINRQKTTGEDEPSASSHEI
ncbi:MAG: hypothetical protein JW861_03465 [Bacteroidales bacterium]|nr:hypothetical protein [Bacteroidales bacterium]